MAQRDLVTGLVQVGNLLTRRLAPLFARSDITPQQWAVLSVLAEAGGPLTMVAVARAMAVSKQNMTGMLARLEQLGLAERAGNPADLRASAISLTRRGRAVVDKLRPAYQQWLSELLSGAVTDRERQALVKTIEKLIAALGDSEEA